MKTYSMRNEKPKSPGREAVLVMLCCLTFATLTVIGAVYSAEAVDKFMDDLKHQVYTTVAVCLLGLVLWIVWKWKR